MDTDSPTLKARVLVCIALENLERNALLPETLGEAEPTKACSINEYVHLDDSIRFDRGIERLGVIVCMVSFTESNQLHL